MRRDIQAQGTTLTVGELRQALEGVDDAAPVTLSEDPEYAGLNVEAALGADLSLVLRFEYECGADCCRNYQ